MPLTDHEQSCVHQLSRDVCALNESVNGLKTQIQVQIKAEESCRGEVKAQHLVLFGIDGDRENPGLQRIVDEHGRRINEHGKRLNEHDGKFDTADKRHREAANWWSSNWMLLVIMVVSNAALAWLTHIWK
jgi:hypothetical protein